MVVGLALRQRSKGGYWDRCMGGAVSGMERGPECQDNRDGLSELKIKGDRNAGIFRVKHKISTKDNI